ncbi:hypothetical protein ILUMI_27180 [Ignelater luminosus]|uniref:J domain-containing protein n=1 Tax=Ignelater luminosus TaxID=2038154 RepID=A0A8K0FY79_IGNLU|nr:hypothetical protein ILUMI_27180 [Ignelater luminosus]
MHSINSMRIVQQNIRSLSNTATVRARNHYDSLGITPKATQADVKGAYYKLSMIYHPDKNEGCDVAAQKFRDITEAYEVLGNVRLRKLYDKGVSHIGIDISTEDPSAKFYRSREHRTRPPTTGRTPIYDFDEWSKSHYGATFARDMERKRKTQFYRDIVEKENQDLKTARFLIAMGVMFAILVYLSYDTRKLDRVTYTLNNNVVKQPTSKTD